MNIAWILCETCMKINVHFIHKKSYSVLTDGLKIIQYTKNNFYTSIGRATWPFLYSLQGHNLKYP